MYINLIYILYYLMYIYIISTMFCPIVIGWYVQRHERLQITRAPRCRDPSGALMEFDAPRKRSRASKGQENPSKFIGII